MEIFMEVIRTDFRGQSKIAVIVVDGTARGDFTLTPALRRYQLYPARTYQEPPS